MLSEENTRFITTNHERGCLLAWDEKLDELDLASSRSFHRASPTPQPQIKNPLVAVLLGVSRETVRDWLSGNKGGFANASVDCRVKIDPNAKPEFLTQSVKEHGTKKYYDSNRYRWR